VRVILHFPNHHRNSKGNPLGDQTVVQATNSKDWRAVRNSPDVTHKTQVLAIQKDAEIHITFHQALAGDEETRNPRYAQAAALITLHQHPLPLPEAIPMLLTLHRPQLKQGFMRRTNDSNKGLSRLETLTHTDWWNHIVTEEGPALVRHLDFQTPQMPKLGQVLAIQKTIKPEELHPELCKKHQLWQERVEEYQAIWDKINYPHTEEYLDKTTLDQANHWASQKPEQILWVKTVLEKACRDLTSIIRLRIPAKTEIRFAIPTSTEIQKLALPATHFLEILIGILKAARSQSAQGLIRYDDTIRIVHQIQLILEIPEHPVIEYVNERTMALMPFPSWFLKNQIPFRGEFPTEVASWTRDVIQGTHLKGSVILPDDKWPQEETPAYRELTQNLRIQTLAKKQDGSRIIAGLIQKGLAPEKWKHEKKALDKEYQEKHFNVQHIANREPWRDEIIKHDSELGKDLRQHLAEQL
jgi:hypothetical protein